MSRVLLLLTVLASGCKTAEFAVDHQMTGIHVAAKFEAMESSRDYQPSPMPPSIPLPASSYGLASHDLGAMQSQWNGGDASDSLRR
jgi:hypothetical protein